MRGSWQRKYLDYRTLAEGLRVQFYWAAAGVTSGSVSKFAHDNFLQMQDTELGWIRNVMRVAGMECDVAPNLDPRGVEFAVAEWIGDDKSGQLGYYRKKSAQRIVEHESTHAHRAARHLDHDHRARPRCCSSARAVGRRCRRRSST